MQNSSFILVIFISFLLGSPALANANDRVQNYQEYMVPYLEWAQRNPEEREVLNIFPAFKPPVVRFKRYGIEESRTEAYTTYVTKMQVIILKSAAHLKLEDLARFETVQKMSAELKHRPIQSHQVMPLLAGKAAIENFKWCNEGQWLDSFQLPQKETNLSYMINPERPWCKADGRTLCLETCYHFSPGWKAAVQIYNNTLGSKDPKDAGQAMQSEIRYFVSEAEYGSRVPLARLTQINTPVRGVMEQNTFYFNQVFTWAKVVAVFQEHPTDSQKTVMTTLAAFNMRSKYCQDGKYKDLCKAIKGESKGRLGVNTKTGISAGIPVYSREIAAGLAKILEGR